MSHFHDELRDRGVHLDLRETEGGERAPDLTAAILARLDDEAQAATASGPSRGRRLLLAACVVLGIGAVVAVASLTRERDQAVEAGDGAIDEWGDQDPNATTQPPTDRHPVDGLPEREGTFETTLENGMHLLVRSVPGSGWVGMQAVYDVGFVHEPAGMTQAAHLVEHLHCMGATASFGEGESFAKLNELGIANAETLADCTHYDFILPAAHLELALRIEAERLTSLAFSEAQIRHEADRADSEADFAEQNPATGMLKHAFMALNQHWAHGAERAEVRGLLATLDPDALRTFHRSGHRPDRLTLVILGDVTVERARELVERHLGGLANPEAPALRIPAWDRLPDRSEVRWNTSVRGVVLTWAPPAGAGERLETTVEAAMLFQQLASDRELAEAKDSVFCSNITWPVRDLPLFVYATAADGVDLEDFAKLLDEKARAAMRRVFGPMSRQVGVQWVEGNRTITDRQIEMEAQRLANRLDPKVPAEALVMGQRALNWALAVRGAASPAALQATPEHAMSVFADQRPKVTLLRPE